MSFFKKLFGFFKKKEVTKPEITEETQEEVASTETVQKEEKKKDELPWIEASDNEWGVKILDLRSVSKNVISTSRDSKMAENAVSYGGKNGTEFWGIKPDNDKTISTDISFPIDAILEPGVLFIPDVMEKKWAIYFDGMYLIFVRSWLREVFVIAKTSQKNNQLIIENVIGEFTPNESPEFTQAVLRFLLISHVMREEFPAPLSKDFVEDTNQAAIWAFSLYGNMADFGIFDENFVPKPKGILRSDSLLHIAVAKSEENEIVNLIRKGLAIDGWASDGLSPLHWSIITENTDSLSKLLELGADPNVRSYQGATPIMNAVQANKKEHLALLLKSGAFVNAKDNRGYTALHRAAEINHLEIVKILLDNRADKNIEAEGNTALSLAITRNNKEIIELLGD
ncbi:ankyrin repeat domain-containing protein [Chryseobacterium oryctis]|uniref:Ankyrin repeat domain-containing protein n=1 Tax=Chryseobacterium oryctis TaxID=2952618 RepID=A0ABT3HMT0_9FLAO|nr:ankyrin repeat domain-containing protein [Chryseobacterium oryctis]MCW3161103.1 ankyrin repeat domain-containing protein [Chryseobacterium oryctis]